MKRLKMNVRQSHQQTLQTKQKKSLSHQIFRFKQKFYCALASLVQKHEEDTWYLDSSPCFYPADDANSDDTEYLSPHLRRLYPYTWHFDMGTPPIMGDTNHFIRDALYTLYHVTFNLLASLSCSTGPQVMFNWSPDTVQLVPRWCSTGPKRMFNWSLCQNNLQLSLTYLTDEV